jgi:hypothetical protein
MFNSFPNVITLGQEEGTGGEFQGSIFGLFGAHMESFGFDVWLDVGRTAFERLTCLPSTIWISLPSSHELRIMSFFRFTGTAAVKG